MKWICATNLLPEVGECVHFLRYLRHADGGVHPTPVIKYFVEWSGYDCTHFEYDRKNDTFTFCCEDMDTNEPTCDKSRGRWVICCGEFDYRMDADDAKHCFWIPAIPPDLPKDLPL